jgi:hypothetical protein
MAEILTPTMVLAAGRAYHSREEEQGDSVYMESVVSTRDWSPARRVDHAVSFLRSWNALRSRGLTDTRAKRLIRGFIKDNRDDILSTRATQLARLKQTDIDKIGAMFDDARARGLGPTAVGKLLHFLMPDTVLLWDQKTIRSVLWLGPESKEFLRYQLFGKRLLAHLEGVGGPRSLQRMRARHRVAAGGDEPLTKLVDELFYDESGMRERTILALGGLGPALASIFAP